MACSKCSDRAGSIALGVSVSVAGLLFTVAVVSYAVSGESEGRARGVVERAGRFVPLQSVMVVIVAWKVLTQVRGLGRASNALDSLRGRPCATNCFGIGLLLSST